MEGTQKILTSVLAAGVGGLPKMHYARQLVVSEDDRGNISARYFYLYKNRNKKIISVDVQRIKQELSEQLPRDLQITAVEDEKTNILLSIWRIKS